MKRWVIAGVTAIVLGYLCAGITAHGETPKVTPRFYVSDASRVGERQMAYILHDRKSQEVCFLVLEVYGEFHGYSYGYSTGVTMTPRMC